MTEERIVVIGAGAGGMMAACRAAELGAEVLLLEKADSPGKKILISGKSRCNLTNAKPLDDFISMYGPNGRFLYGAFNKFFRDDLLAFLKRYGVETKTERGGRIFPASDDARDVLGAFRRCMTERRVHLQTGAGVRQILIENSRVTGVRTSQEVYPTFAVILASGGASFPATGSTGDGYRLASELGHTIVPLRPALVPLVVKEVERAKSMQGVSLKNVRLTAFRGSTDEIDFSRVPAFDCGRGIAGKRPHKSVVESRMGEMMFTHFGIGGPVTLLMSLAVADALKEGSVSVSLDLKPALTDKQLHNRIQGDLEDHSKRSYRNILKGLLPLKMIDPVIEMSGIPSEKLGHEITATDRDRLVSSLKSIRFNIERPLSLSSAMVTAGGVSLKEINPKTMESKLIRGLYLCGEVMDIDGDTGGYNLQAAFSTGYVAGEAAGISIKA